LNRSFDAVLKSHKPGEIGCIFPQVFQNYQMLNCQEKVDEHDQEEAEEE